ncbi:MAG: response regulator [Gemmatimonadota bacterium]
MKTLLTTGDIASHCQVTLQTANNWIKGGQLKAFRTPGRHQRVQLSEFERFLAEHGMPPYAPAREWEAGRDVERRAPGSPGRGWVPAPRSGAPERPRILVVDDDPAVVRLITRYLAQAGGYELAVAADGFEAGAQVYRFQPDLVLLDLMMPNVDGFSVCQRIKAGPETAHIQVLVMTGYASEANIKAARERGADDCLSKPFQIEQLKLHIDQLLGRAARPRTSTT